MNTVAQSFKHGVGLQANIFSFKEAYTDNTGLNYPVLTTGYSRFYVQSKFRFQY
jgi:hypothetical protein